MFGTVCSSYIEQKNWWKDEQTSKKSVNGKLIKWIKLNNDLPNIQTMKIDDALTRWYIDIKS